jgi:hypothetical protein
MGTEMAGKENIDVGRRCRWEADADGEGNRDGQEDRYGKEMKMGKEIK